MAKEWILNSVMNRFQLNFKRNVGATSESIRKCSPKTLEEWREYYFNNVKSQAHIEDLGRKLYIKISEVILSEVNEVTEQDCIDYMIQIKPVNAGIQLPEIFKEYALQAETHKKFTEVFGGKVFYLFSTKVGDRKEIQNKDVIDEIRQEIERLKPIL